MVRIKMYSIYGMLFCFFALFYGLIPGVTFPGFATNFLYLGEISGNEFFHTSNILYPYGSYVNEGFYFYFVGRVLYQVFGDEIFSVTLTYLSIYITSFFSMIVLGKKLSLKSLPMVFVIVIFYLDPFIIGNMGLQVVGYGMMIAPLSVLCDYIICQNSGKWLYNRQYLMIISLLVISRLIIVAIGWYSAVSLFVFSTIVTLYVFVKHYIENRYEFFMIFKYILLCIIPWGISVVILYCFMPDGITELSTKDIAFFNGNSVGIATLFLPGHTQYISNFISIDDFIPSGYSLVGDGGMWVNYLGFSIILMSVIGIVKRYDALYNDKNFYMGVLLALVVGFWLSLGPGLKVLGLTELVNVGKYKGYLLPLEDTIKLPWSELYLYFPLSMMRAVYRWLLISKLALLLLSSYGLNSIYSGGGKYKFIAISLSILAFFEFIPASRIDYTISNKFHNYQSLEEIRTEIIIPLEDKVNDYDRLVVCSYDDSDNGFILPYIMQQLHVVTFAGCGDKSMALAKKYIPEKILKLQHENDPYSMSILIGDVLDKNLCDGVLLPYFRIRWESYYWPWDRKESMKYKELALSIKEILENKYYIYENDYYVYIKRLE